MKVSIVLFVIGLLAACGGTLPTQVATPERSAAQEQTQVPSPVPTPTEARSMPSPGDIDAPGNCDHVPGITSYDVRSIATAPNLQWTYNIQVSGDDYHLHVTAKEEGGFSGEIIGINGVNYERGRDGEWKQSEQYLPLHFLHLLHPIESDFVLCPDLEIGAVTRIGEELLNGDNVEHFRLPEGSDVGPLANVGGVVPAFDPIDRTWDIWVDSEGKLVRTTLSADYAATSSYAAFRVEIRSNISGIGETNVIVEPALPTPTPTPTAAP